MSTATESMPPVLFPDDWARTSKADPISSHEAADRTDKEASNAAVLELFHQRAPMAQFEAEEALAGRRFSASRVRSSFTELERDGLVKRLGREHRIPNRNGNLVQLWDLA